MKNEPTNILIGRLRGAIRSYKIERALEILEVLSSRVNSFQEVKNELDSDTGYIKQS